MFMKVARRRLLEAVLPLPRNRQLFRSSGAVQPTYGQNQVVRRFVSASRTVVRPVAARPQARQTERGIAFKMLIAGLAADAELLV